MNRVGELLGPMRDLRNVKPPVDVDKITGRVSGGSYDRWQRFFEDALPIAGDSPFGHALKKCYSFLREKRLEGAPYESAMQDWNAQCEAAAAAKAAAERERLEALKRAQAERDPKRRRRAGADELFTYADETIR